MVSAAEIGNTTSVYHLRIRCSGLVAAEKLEVTARLASVPSQRRHIPETHVLVCPWPYLSSLIGSSFSEIRHFSAPSKFLRVCTWNDSSHNYPPHVHPRVLFFFLGQAPYQELSERNKTLPNKVLPRWGNTFPRRGDHIAIWVRTGNKTTITMDPANVQEVCYSREKRVWAYQH